MPTITTARTTPTTIPVTLVVDFLVDTADGAGGKADAPRFKAPVGEVTAAVEVGMLASELVEEVIVRDTVLEIIFLPFRDRRTPVPLLQQSGELSQQ